MAKFKTVYVCQECGAQHLKWSGQCGACKAWNSLVEEVTEKKKGRSQKSKVSGVTSGKVVKLSELNQRKKPQKRFSTGSHEFDRVLGGGIVPGSVVLIAGEPGVGKSTLLTQLAMQLGGSKEVLYVCGEESPEQVGLRVRRLSGRDLSAARKQTASRRAQDDTLESKSLSSVSKEVSVNLQLLAETNVDAVVATAQAESPGVVIVDSVQTMHTQDLSGMAGSVGQVRESSLRLAQWGKQSGVAVFLVGHVTKTGSIAGPKVLEHMVDAVLELSGEMSGQWRILRAQKNRFGATDEVRVLQMSDSGMEDVDNPSGAFLEESQAGVPGSAVVALMEGTRPVLVEVQALVVSSQLPVPRRVSHGVPLSKVQLLTAVLQKRCRVNLGTKDIYVNVAGGLKIDEPAADLGVALAIASSAKGKALPKKSVMVGEVGLLGEVRRVSFLDRRIKEAKKLGYSRVISPGEVGSLLEGIRKGLGK